jgi:uncharacterized protein YhbP (UPF0306 family)
MSSKDWEVGPVLKDKLGSQGTLFRGGTKYSSPQRFPRGYTPERQAEVRAAVQGTDTRLYDDEVLPAHLQRTRIADTVARSTVPVAHLQGLQWAHVGEGQAIDHADTAAGAYFRSHEVKEGSVTATRTGSLRSTPMIAVKPEYDRDSTVIHEVGHHVSHTVAGNDHRYDENGHSGAEEAWADNYAEQHYRDKSGKPVEQGIYGGGQFAGHIQRSDQFWDSYAKNRTWGVSKASNDAADEDYYRKYPEERTHPDGTYDAPLIHKEYASQGEEHTTEQPMRINDDAYPEDTPWHEKYKW